MIVTIIAWGNEMEPLRSPASKPLQYESTVALGRKIRAWTGYNLWAFFLGKSTTKHHRPDKGSKDKISIRKGKTLQQVYTLYLNLVAYQSAANGQGE